MIGVVPTIQVVSLCMTFLQNILHSVPFLFCILYHKIAVVCDLVREVVMLKFVVELYGIGILFCSISFNYMTRYIVRAPILQMDQHRPL